jgi:hypothetical protein
MEKRYPLCADAAPSGPDHVLVAAVEPHFHHFCEMTQTNFQSSSAIMQADTIF